jgi:purine-binding chemotaxis protein CheW
MAGLPSLSAGRAAPSAPADAGRGVVAVRLGAQEFALDIMAVREIRSWTAPTPLPGAQAHVHGTIDLRGAIIPVLDLGLRLGLAIGPPGPHSVVVVAEIGGRLVGLRVDGVSDLIHLDPGRLQPTPATGGGEPEAIVQGLFELDGRILGLIALDAVIPAEAVEAAA